MIKLLGGALSQARGVFSNWWSNLTTAQNTINQDNIINASKDLDDLSNKSVNEIDISTAQKRIQDV